MWIYKSGGNTQEALDLAHNVGTTLWMTVICLIVPLAANYLVASSTFKPELDKSMRHAGEMGEQFISERYTKYAKFVQRRSYHHGLTLCLYRECTGATRILGFVCGYFGVLCVCSGASQQNSNIDKGIYRCERPVDVG